MPKKAKNRFIFRTLVTLATIAVTAPSLAKPMYWFTVCTNIKASMINTIVTLAIADMGAASNKDESTIKSKRTDNKSDVKALPATMMVLSAVMLASWFTGFLKKLGTTWNWSISDLHTRGTELIKNGTDELNRCRRIVARMFNKMLCYGMAAQVMLQLSLVNMSSAHACSSIPPSHPPEATRSRDMATCFTTETTIGSMATVLANGTINPEDYTFTFDTSQTEFGTDNCATHHVCSQRELFVELRTPDKEIGVRGVSGSSTAAGIGTVIFNLKDDDGRQHKIKLNNVVYLPDSAKNLLSIAQWSTDREHTWCSNGVTTSTPRASITHQGARYS